jgi:predicted TIM-barrel fold metal-dependent hydrolase
MTDRHTRLNGPHDDQAGPGDDRPVTARIRHTALSSVPAPVLRKILHDNAARMYRLN